MMNPQSIIRKKDQKLTGGYLLAFFVFNFLKVIFSMTYLSWGKDPVYFEVICPLIFQVLNFMTWIIVMMMIPIIVQDDPIYGTRAFWRTKPIGGGALFAAKLDFLSLVSIFIISLKYAGIGFENDWLLSLSAMIFLWLAAIFTASIRQYFLVVLLGFLGFVALLFGLSISLNDFSLAEMATQYDYALLGLFLISLFVIGLLYSNDIRKIILSILPYGCFIILLVFLGHRVHALDYKLIDHFDGKDKKVVTREHQIVLDLNEARVEHIAEGIQKNVVLSAKMNLTGFSKDQFAVISKIDAPRMAYDPSTEGLVSLPLPEIYPVSFRDEGLTEPIAKALKDNRLLNPHYGHQNYVPIFKTNEAAYQHRKGQKGNYQARITAGVYQFFTNIEIPLDENRDKTQKGFRILEKTRNSGGVMIILLDDSLRSWRHHRSFGRAAINREESFEEVYLLINRKTKEAFIADDVRLSGMNHFRIPGFGSPVRYEVKRIDFSSLNGRNEGLPTLDEQWLKDADLVGLCAENIGDIEKTAEFENFYLPAGESKR